MTKVAIIGDTHSDSSFVSAVHKQARTDEVTTIIQLGDFGFSFDRNMIESITAWLSRDDSHRWYWIDGNHDQHDYLDALVAQAGTVPSTPISMAALPFEDMYNRSSKVSFTHFHERLFYVPRGTVFTIGGTTILGLGGAYSIDEHYRKAGYSWWPQELITNAEKALAVHNAHEYGPIDVMITHDGPSSQYLESWLDRFGYKVDPKSNTNRMNVTDVVNRVRPKALFHGHYHERYDTLYETPQGHNVEVHGIAANIPDSKVRPGKNYITVDM